MSTPAFLLFSFLFSYASAQDSFCVQFFGDVWTKSPLVIRANDSTKAGDVLKKQFTPGTSRTRVQFSGGDLEYVLFNPKNMTMRALQSFRSQLGKRLSLHGTCDDYIEILAIPISLDVQIDIEIIDSNDPPVFLNLPAVVDMEESTPVNTVLYTVTADDPYDVYHENRLRHFRIKNVTSVALDDTETDIFSITDDGKFVLERPVDYEQGARGYYVAIEVEDEGKPQMRNVSVIVVNVIDMDDERPEFEANVYHAVVIAEKPVQPPEECIETNPPIKAIDLDKDKKSELNYRIVEGYPDEDVSQWRDYFRLHEETGRLCQRQTLQRLLTNNEVEEFYNFTFRIEAFQRDNPEKADFATLYVSVNDKNEHTPEFRKKLWRVSIPEYPELKDGDLVAQVEAKDGDFGRNAEFMYHIIGGDTTPFYFNQETGELRVRKAREFDRERRTMYQVEVACVETRSLERKESANSATVKITLEDVNDNSPVFEKTSYRYVVNDNHPEGTPLQKGNSVIATDRDAGLNGQIKYMITSMRNTRGSTSLSDIGRFSILDDGQIILNRNFRMLRRMKKFPEYLLEVEAQDLAEDKQKRRSTKVSVTVEVVESNEHGPVFLNPHLQEYRGSQALELGYNENTPAEFTAYVPEDSPVGSLVTKLLVKDDDGDEDIYLTYKIVSGNDDKEFEISSRGWLTHAKSLDREDHEIYELDIHVTDGIHSATAVVRVFVIDSNDNSPNFNETKYIFEIIEHSDVGTSVGTIYATDIDEGVNGEVSYSIKPADSSDIDGLFVVNSKDGNIVIHGLSNLFDKEQNSVFNLIGVASDGGEPSRTATAEIEIQLMNINDNPPIFKRRSYHGTVQEDNDEPVPNQSVQMDDFIEVSDLDGSTGDVRFSIQGAGRDVFLIDPITANITVTNPGTIDCEIKCYYNLKIIATDNMGYGFSNIADLNIDVKDVNDNPPIFTEEYIFDLQSEMSVGNMIGHVKAEDADIDAQNNQVLYILKNGGFGKFGVDFETGAIMLQDDMSREPMQSEYELQIQAFDTGSPRRSGLTGAKIRVPFNSAPSFTGNYSFTLAENQMSGSVVGTVAAFDKNRDAMKYFLKEKLPFKVNPITGQITTKAMIDREDVSQINFMVYVKDGGIPALTSSAEVTVYVLDLNDHRPIFGEKKYTGKVYEDDSHAEPGQNVRMYIPIAAKDNDENYENRNIMYSLSGENSDYFRIDSQTAQITVSEKGGGKLDREFTDSYKLKVTATDQSGAGLRSSVELTIEVEDANDNAPVFLSYPTFEVSNKVNVGEAVGFVVAQDADATKPNNEIIYVLEGDTYGKFSIDMAAGTITVMRALYQEPYHQEYNLHVVAVDKGSPTRTSDTMIEIKTLGGILNENSPMISGENVFFLVEEQPVGTLVGSLRPQPSSSIDEHHITFQMVTNDYSLPFEVTEVGDIRVKYRIDRDKGDKFYKFDVQATSHGFPPKNETKMVIVVIQDVNDNPPVFTQPQYTHKVHPLFPSASIVATPFAYDPFDEIKSTYAYELMDLNTGENPDFLYIESDTGIVRANYKVATQKKGTYYFSLKARDINEQYLDTEAILKIDVIDEGSLIPCPCRGENENEIPGAL